MELHTAGRLQFLPSHGCRKADATRRGPPFSAGMCCESRGTALTLVRCYSGKRGSSRRCMCACVPGAVILQLGAGFAGGSTRTQRLEGGCCCRWRSPGFEKLVESDLSPPNTASDCDTSLQTLACKIWCTVPLPTEADVSGIRRRRPLCYSSHVHRLQKRIKKDRVCEVFSPSD